MTKSRGASRLNHDGRALNEDALYKIQANIFAGLYDDREISRLFETIWLQRKILRALLSRYKSEPLRLVSTAEPIRNSELAHFKELASMEDCE